MNYSYPSAEFPALCGLQLEVPAGWAADAAPLALMVLADGASEPDFRVNLTVKTDRIDGGLTLQQVVDGIAPGEGPEAITVLASELTEVDGYEAVLRVQSLELDEAPMPLFQAEALIRVPTVNPALADLVVFHATSTAGTAEKYGPLFRSVIDSIRITPWDG